VTVIVALFARFDAGIFSKGLYFLQWRKQVQGKSYRNQLQKSFVADLNFFLVLGAI